MTTRNHSPIARAALVAALAVAAGCVLRAPAAAVTVEAMRVPVGGPLVDLDAAYWNDAAEQIVTLLPQSVTMPTHPDPAVRELRVRAVHNGQWLALLMEWDDDTRSDRIVVDEFGDQVAVQLPVRHDPDSMPSPMMGHAGARVSIVQWRAAFQRDVDEGEPTVRDLYPYALIDSYPDEVLRATDAAPYQGAISVDSPMSRPGDSPLLEQVAEGWGTLTVKPRQTARGRGVWSDGRWQVVIAQPMGLGGDNDPQLAAGDRSMVAFAVWEGGHAEVGSRKSWSPWIPIELMEASDERQR